MLTSLILRITAVLHWKFSRTLWSYRAWCWKLWGLKAWFSRYASSFVYVQHNRICTFPHPEVYSPNCSLVTLAAITDWIDRVTGGQILCKRCSDYGQFEVEFRWHTLAVSLELTQPLVNLQARPVNLRPNSAGVYWLREYQRISTIICLSYGVREDWQPTKVVVYCGCSALKGEGDAWWKQEAKRD